MELEMFWLVVVVLAIIIIIKSVAIVPQQHAWVVERLGKYDRTLAPGPRFVIPFIEKIAYKHVLKEIPGIRITGLKQGYKRPASISRTSVDMSAP